MKIFIKKILNIIGLEYYIWLRGTYFNLRTTIKALYYGLSANKNSDNNIFNFRRSIHRIEKGLSSSKLKDVFAEDYIIETVINLEAGENLYDHETECWGQAVLSQYFEKVKKTEQVEKAYQIFKKIDKKFDKIQVPYCEGKRPPLSVNYDDLMTLSIRRRSVRYFENKPVTEGIIKKAYEIAKYSPSACNRQAFSFYFYNEKEIVSRLSAIPGGAKGYELPSLIVIVGNYSGYFDIRDINAPVIDASLTVMSFIYALETLGLASVCINWPCKVSNEKKIREIINLEPYEFVIMMMGIGYPLNTGKIPYSAKRNPDEVIIVN